MCGIGGTKSLEIVGIPERSWTRTTPNKVVDRVEGETTHAIYLVEGGDTYNWVLGSRFKSKFD